MGGRIPPRTPQLTSPSCLCRPDPRFRRRRLFTARLHDTHVQAVGQGATLHRLLPAHADVLLDPGDVAT